MSTFGRKVEEKFGFGINVSADGRPQAKAGGVTFEWAGVTAAVSAYTVLPPGGTAAANFFRAGAADIDYVDAGEKFLRYGTVIQKIVGGTSAGKYVPYGTSPIPGSGTALSAEPGDVFIVNGNVHEADSYSDHPEAIYGGRVWKNRILANYGYVQTITISATGGTFTVTYKGQTTSALAYNASASTVQTALNGLSTIGASGVTVALASSVYTITFASTFQTPDLFTTNAASLIGGSQTATVALATGVVTAGPTLAELKTMLPNLEYVND